MSLRSIPSSAYQFLASATYMPVWFVLGVQSNASESGVRFFSPAVRGEFFSSENEPATNATPNRIKNVKKKSLRVFILPSRELPHRFNGSSDGQSWVWSELSAGISSSPVTTVSRKIKLAHPQCAHYTQKTMAKAPSFKTRSTVMTEGDSRAPNRAMSRATGFKDADFEKPIVGIASTWSEVTPCNMHIDKLALAVHAGARKSGAVAQTFGTITVSDGIAMGHEGMKYSLVSREVIADSIETVAGAERFDGLVTIGGCDKNMPGCMIAIARVNTPSIFVYGGTIMPGKLDGKDVDIVSIFEAVGQFQAHKINEKQLKAVECKACPGPGSCGGMYTANTMSAAIEAMGMALPHGSTHPAISADKKNECAAAGKQVYELIKRGLKPRDIMTKKAFENAITVVMAVGGSTNAVLHLPAIARAAGVELTMEDFNRISDRTPLLTDMKPGGKYLTVHLDKAGGIPAIMKELLDAGLLHGDCMTVTGKTVAENLKGVKKPKSITPVIHDIKDT